MAKLEISFSGCSCCRTFQMYRDDGTKGTKTNIDLKHVDEAIVDWRRIFKEPETSVIRLDKQ